MGSDDSADDVPDARYFNLVRYYFGTAPGGRRFVASVRVTNLEGETLEDPADFVRQTLHMSHRPQLITEATADSLRWNRKVTMINYQLYVWWLN